jgi:hypothetical protein
MPVLAVLLTAMLAIAGSGWRRSEPQVEGAPHGRPFLCVPANCYRRAYMASWT